MRYGLVVCSRMNRREDWTLQNFFSWRIRKKRKEEEQQSLIFFLVSLIVVCERWVIEQLQWIFFFFWGGINRILLGAKKHLHLNHKFFLASIKRRYQIKVDQRLKKISITPLSVIWRLVVCHFVMSSVWLAKSPEIWNAHQWIYTEKSESATKRDKRLTQKDTNA